MREVLEPLGPAPVVRAPIPEQGFLCVYSPAEVRSNGFGDVDYYLHSDFSVYSLAGEIVRQVRNADDPSDDTPAVTPLPTGAYQLRSRTKRSGLVTVTVVIETGQTTTVYFDGSFHPSDAPSEQYVTLSTGEILGVRAHDSARP